MERSDLTLKHADLNFHVTAWGPTDAPPVVMLHGIRGFGETFAQVAGALQPNFRVIAFDQRGRGRTDWDPRRDYYTDTYVADIAAIVDGLGLERFNLLGHSMGGINAIVYAARHPHRIDKLIVEDAGPGAFESSPGANRIRREMTETPTRFDDWDSASAFMRALRPTVTEEARQQRLESMLKSEAEGGGFTWRYDHAGIAATRLFPDPDRLVDLRAHVAELACDTMVIRGGNSDYLQSEMVAEMKRLNPRIQETVIDGAGHYVHDDQPEAFNQAVRAFLSGGH